MIGISSPMPNAQLVVVFNHRYDANLAKLDAVYAGRFDGTRYLMPFYDGDRPDVIPVYESSGRFEGFFAQAYRSLAGIDADFLVFAGDDLLLHPRLTQDNLPAELGLTADAGRPPAGYAKVLMTLAEQPTWWQHTIPTLRAMRGNTLAQGLAQLPDAAEARRRIERHGVRVDPVGRAKLVRTAVITHRGILARVGPVNFALRRHRPGYEYPLVSGYSDFLVVPRADLREFCRLCGILAAMDIWPEVAAPTALALACDRVVVERQTRWRGTELWAKADVDARLAPAGTDVAKLLAGYADDELYVHPVKLSKFAAARRSAPTARPDFG